MHIHIHTYIHTHTHRKTRTHAQQMVIVAAHHIVLTRAHLLPDHTQPQSDVSQWRRNASTPQRPARAELRHFHRRRHHELRKEGDGRHRLRLRQGRKCSLFSRVNTSENYQYSYNVVKHCTIHSDPFKDVKK